MQSLRYDAISNVIGRVCRRFGVKFYPELAKFSAIWRETVGLPIYRNTEVKRFQKGIAWIKTPSPTWRFELTQMKSQVIDRLNKVYGYPKVKDIRINIGPISPRGEVAATPMAVEKIPPLSALPPDEAAWIRKCTEEIPDEDIRQSSQRILSAYLTRRTPWD
jgi:hypothetical protein